MTAPPRRCFFIVAGEASGDQLGGAVATALRQRLPADQLQLRGVGGSAMAAAGVELLFSADELSVMGIVEVIRHYPRLKRLLNRCIAELTTSPPDLLLTIDYPGFNLRLAAAAKRLGIPVLHWVSPQIWAWRAGRIQTIQQRVDHMALLFDFELPYYQRAGLAATVVGHPMVQRVKSVFATAEAARVALGLQPTGEVIGLFPGSRVGEVERIFPLLLETAYRLWQHDSTRQYVVAPASALLEAQMRRQLAQRPHPPPLHFIADRPFDLMRSCDLILAASGTVTLEIALMQVPMVVVYRMAPLSYAILSRLVTIPHIALCNIVAEAAIVPELIQQQATAANLTRIAADLLASPTQRATMKQQLAQIRGRLREGDPAQRVAELALQLATRASPSPNRPPLKPLERAPPRGILRPYSLLLD